MFNLSARLKTADQQRSDVIDHDLESHVAALTKLHELTLRLAEIDDVRTALQAILGTLVELHQAKLGLLSLYDPETGHLHASASVGFDDEALKIVGEIMPKPDAGACGSAFFQKKRVVVSNIETDPCFDKFRDVAQGIGFTAVHSTPILNRKGEILGVMSVHFEHARTPGQHETQLSDMCARHAAEVIESRINMQLLRDADRKKDEFLAILAHELRNPLAPIRTGLNILKKAGDNKTLRDKAQNAMELQFNQLVRLVDDLLDISRITRGRIDLDKKEIELKSVISMAIETAHPMIDDMGHHLTVKMPDQPIYIDGDALRLTQVFSNLLNNAAKYTDRGGAITLAVEMIDNEVRVDVIDNGIGIEENMLHHIFDMFSQVSGSLSRSHGGLGIGLTLVKSLVDMHDGRVDVLSSGLGCGSCFSVTLPLLPQPVRPVLVDGSGILNASAERNLRVLVVDDNLASAQTLAWMVELWGHAVEIEQDGRDAIEKAKTYLPDIVLLDIGLPGISGHEVCMRMKAIPELNKTLFIAQTGWSQDKDRATSKAAGFDHHLVKPLDMQFLEELMATKARAEIMEPA